MTIIFSKHYKHFLQKLNHLYQLTSHFPGCSFLELFQTKQGLKHKIHDNYYNASTTNFLFDLIVRFESYIEVCDTQNTITNLYVMDINNHSSNLIFNKPSDYISYVFFKL